MLRENTPTDNCVAERLVRTFKEHKIYKTTIEEKIASAMAMSPTFNSYRKYLNQYVKSLNNKPNNKSKGREPEWHDNDVTTAVMLIVYFITILYD